MALEPISRNFHSAAARLRHAAYIGATVGLMTLSNFAAAKEQTVGIGPASAATTTEAPNEFEPISKRECTIIFATSSKLVGDIVKGKDTEPAFKKEPWDPIFAEGLARFIAPAKVAPVYKIIV